MYCLMDVTSIQFSMSALKKKKSFLLSFGEHEKMKKTSLALTAHFLHF